MFSITRKDDVITRYGLLSNQLLRDTLGYRGSTNVDWNDVMKDDVPGSYLETAFTDGINIWMPREFFGIRLDGMKNPDQKRPRETKRGMRIGNGLVMHEIGHFMQPLGECAEVARRMCLPRSILNVLLDIHLESHLHGISPKMARYNLGYLRLHVKKNNQERWIKGWEDNNSTFQDEFIHSLFLCRFASGAKPFVAKKKFAQNRRTKQALAFIGKNFCFRKYRRSATRFKMPVNGGDLPKLILQFCLRFPELCDMGEGTLRSLSENAEGIESSYGESQSSANKESNSSLPTLDNVAGDARIKYGDDGDDDEIVDTKGNSDSDDDSNSDSNSDSDDAQRFRQVSADMVAFGNERGKMTSPRRVVSGLPKPESTILSKRMKSLLRKDKATERKFAVSKVKKRKFVSKSIQQKVSSLYRKVQVDKDIGRNPVICLDTSGSMSSHMKVGGEWSTRAKQCLIATQALTLAVKSSGGSVTSLLFDETASLDPSNSDSLFFSKHDGIYVRRAGTTFEWLSQVWHKFPGRQVVIVTDGDGYLPATIREEDRRNTTIVMVGDGCNEAAASKIAGTVIHVNDIDELPAAMLKTVN